MHKKTRRNIKRDWNQKRERERERNTQKEGERDAKR